MGEGDRAGSRRDKEDGRLDVGGSEGAVGKGCNAQRFLKEPAISLKHQVLD